jgi:hypothetical protein
MFALAMDEHDDITDNVQVMTFVRGTDHAFSVLANLTSLCVSEALQMAKICS